MLEQFHNFDFMFSGRAKLPLSRISQRYPKLRLGRSLVLPNIETTSKQPFSTLLDEIERNIQTPLVRTRKRTTRKLFLPKFLIIADI